LFDLPVEELTSYGGRNPRPDDFDEYWARAVEELDETPQETEITPADFESGAANAFDLRFRGVRRADVYAKLLVPRSAVDAPALLVFHGYGGYSGDWFDLLGWAAEGFVVAAMDVRGQSGRSTDPGGYSGTTFLGHIVRGINDGPDHLFYRHVYLDCLQLSRVVAALPEVDPTRISATGASQGGGLALACAALEPSIARVAVLNSFLCDWLRVWELDLARDAYDGLRLHLQLFDPTHERKDAFFETLGYVDVQHLAPWIKAEVLMGTCLMDTVCPPSTQFAAYNKIASQKTVLLYPDWGHGLPRPRDWSDNVFQFLRGVVEQ
jgi:cephalosporin-C deacetylase